ncbi:MAG: DUF6090 family protein [Cyclobacteriaceae bacterium]
MAEEVLKKYSIQAVRKYFLYAIGEILLVVIGILIALQVNNWNENRHEEKQVMNYLSNLKEAIYRDIGSLEGTISFNSLRLKGLFYLLEHADLNTTEFTELNWIKTNSNNELHGLWVGAYPDTLNRQFTDLSFSLLGRGFGGASFDKSVINELYATGHYSNISNQNLKKRIAEYYSYLNQRLEGYAIEEHEEWANEVTRFLRDSYGIFTLDVSAIEDPINTIRGKKDVEMHLRYLALEINYHCLWSSHAIDLANDLVRLIEIEEKDLKNG